MKKLLLLLLCLPMICFGETFTHPFGYDLHLTAIPGKGSRTMICCHGFGGNYKIINSIQQAEVVDATLIGFNAPEYDLSVFLDRNYKVSIGTIRELLPAFYVLKKYIIDDGLRSVDLYGFSMGGGVVINVLAALNTSVYDAELKTIGIGFCEKQTILNAIKQGIVILDSPLKSVEEIIAFRGALPVFDLVARNYRKNNLRPIDSIALLKGLSLNIIVHFQETDEILSNRDDALYIEQLKKANASGNTWVVIADDGGHNTIHRSLWKIYSQKIY